MGKVDTKNLLFLILTVVLLVFILTRTSFALLNNSITTGNVDILVQFGNLQAVLNTQSESYTFKDIYRNPVNDVIGLEQDEYNFSIKNTGSINIGYYEVKLVNQENKSTTLPHKYIRYTIKNNDGEFANPQNLGDNNSILYQGTDLKVGETINLSLKMWINESVGYEAYNKDLYGALEITLYQIYEDDYYIAYDSNGGINNPSKTPVYLNKVTKDVPSRGGYKFKGWALSKTANNVVYQPESLYNQSKGMILYAVWEQVSVMNKLGLIMDDQKNNIVEIVFLKDSRENITIRYDDAIIKSDITLDNQGQVLCWLEGNDISETLYIASSTDIYLNTGDSLFLDFVNLSKIDFSNANFDYITNTNKMFSNVGASLEKATIIVKNMKDKEWILNIDSDNRPSQWNDENIIVKE